MDGSVVKHDRTRGESFSKICVGSLQNPLELSRDPNVIILRATFVRLTHL